LSSFFPPKGSALYSMTNLACSSNPFNSGVLWM
jgi:hypothetical protein